MVAGWLCDEQQLRPPERVELPFKKLGEELALPIPGAQDLAKLGPAATTAALGFENSELLIGWPESIVIVRHAGVVVYGEGDVVHFGPLALDPGHSIMRSGYEYLAETGTEVRVELTVTAGDVTEKQMLAPGQRLTLGPYSVEHDHSFDPGDRPGSVSHHGYLLRVSRRAGTPLPPRPGDVPHPLDVTEPALVAQLARDRQLLGDDEALAVEPKVLDGLLSRYQGPRQQCEEALARIGPSPPRLLRLGELLVVESAAVRRGAKGEAVLSRCTVSLDPTGELAVSHADMDKVPGRLRRQQTQG